MNNVYTSEERRLLLSSLRLLFNSLVQLPTDDPLKRQSREFLARILALLDRGDAQSPAS